MVLKPVVNAVPTAKPALGTLRTVALAQQICSSTTRESETRLTTVHRFAWKASLQMLRRRNALYVTANASVAKEAKKIALHAILRNFLTSQNVLINVQKAL